MSSGRDEWMSGWTDEDKQRNLQSYLGQIPDEFGGPVNGVTGKAYEQLEFDFDFLSDSDAVAAAKSEEYNRKVWIKRDEATNHILQAKAIITMVMDNIGEGGRDFDKQEFALWGASDLLEKAAAVLE